MIVNHGGKLCRHGAGVQIQVFRKNCGSGIINEFRTRQISASSFPAAPSSGAIKKTDFLGKYVSKPTLASNGDWKPIFCPMRFKLTLAYDGRAFAGWQSQPHGGAAQDVLERALARVMQVPHVRVYGAGRTDAGVHALGQVAHFDAPPEFRMDGAAWQRGLNSVLASALRVMACETVPEAFHAQFDAIGKRYDYRVCRLSVLPPLEFERAWHVPFSIDLDALNAARLACVGRHNFFAFAASRGDGRDHLPGYAVRTIWAIDLEETADFLTLRFHGEGFLYKMVRLLAGSIFRVATGRDPLSWLLELLQHPNGRKSQHVAPPGGLYLQKVDYGGELGKLTL
jgi:tRNA pseudouridine38-40 synthase